MESKIPRRQHQFLIGFLVTAAVFVLSVSAHAEDPLDLLIIAHRSVRVDKLSDKDAKAIFLGKTKSWDWGRKIVPVNAKSGTSLRKAFQERTLGMNSSLEESYWERKKITTGAFPPPSFSSPIRAVFAVNGAIGYVFRKDYHKGVVKILLVIPKKSQ
jgi:ABC-type phosphate transport system substrate-binding protein